MRAPLREYSHCFHYCVGFKNSHVKWNNHLKIDSSLWGRFVYISIVIYTIRFARRHFIYSDDDREVGLLQTESAACVFVCVYAQSPSLQKSYRNIIPVGRGTNTTTNADSQLTTHGGTGRPKISGKLGPVPACRTDVKVVMPVCQTYTAWCYIIRRTGNYNSLK